MVTDRQSGRLPDRGPLWQVRRVGLAGGALVVVGTVLPWFQYQGNDFFARDFSRAGIPLSGTIPGTATTSGLAVLVVGLLVLGCAWRGHRSDAYASTLGVAGGIVLAATWPILLSPAVLAPGPLRGDPAAFDSVASGIGLFVTFLGGLLAATSAVVLGFER